MKNNKSCEIFQHVEKFDRGFFDFLPQSITAENLIWHIRIKVKMTFSIRLKFDMINTKFGEILKSLNKILSSFFESDTYFIDLIPRVIFFPLYYIRACFPVELFSTRHRVSILSKNFTDSTKNHTFAILSIDLSQSIRWSNNSRNFA